MTFAHYSVHPTPLGDAFLVVTAEGLVILDLLDGPVDHAVEASSRALHVVPEHRPDTVAPVADQLDEYFAGDRRQFDVRVDWRLVDGFTRAALQAVCDIPYGETASYGEVAIRAGSPGAHRAVGSACARTPISIIVPAHRVVRADGSPGEYGRSPEHKLFLLDLEAPAPRTPRAGQARAAARSSAGE
ncbi:methylated-DNA--[protein]-cysteine S-methyltransferase [Microbacterium sp. TNHR37B]|uniref:methylated-DNA--[protein]-cysteine S-methyltransferase n=1 Tax=Microbacterium sp. TNHR37B TaxID=1775956 RepID=UPI0007B2C697|nr:methylated-DNA--[protein]-cysteine S-methyltransferase [Microbacterium sp. TNHR37B]KZE91537.1 Methylated-DNA--protein-cysteine methyltransferase [Microbacterium sp. TNHR37B]